MQKEFDKQKDINLKSLLVRFLKWYDALPASSKVSVWSKDGSTTGLFTMDEEQLVDKFCQLEANEVKDLVRAIFNAGRAKTFTAVTDDGFNHFVYTYDEEKYLKQLGL